MLSPSSSSSLLWGDGGGGSWVRTWSCRVVVVVGWWCRCRCHRPWAPAAGGVVVVVALSVGTCSCRCCCCCCRRCPCGHLQQQVLLSPLSLLSVGCSWRCCRRRR